MNELTQRARVYNMSWLQMGKLYKRLGNLGAAQRNLEMALSLNSTSSADAGLIKVCDTLCCVRRRRKGFAGRDNTPSY